jgi:hypothetical protein
MTAFTPVVIFAAKAGTLPVRRRLDRITATILIGVAVETG